jgi:hypothetical protein
MGTPLSPPFGTWIRLLFDEGGDELDITLNTPGNFRGGEGTGRLDMLGWDRVEQTEFFRGSSFSATGTSFQVGPQHRIPYLFSGQLLLLESEVRTIEAMFLRQQDSPEEDILLFDHKIMLSEATPRTRARHDAGSSAPTVVAGMTQFWAIYRVEISSFQVQSLGRRGSGGIRYSYNLELQERFPALGVGGDR